MTKLDDGGPAFPRPYSRDGHGDEHFARYGMSLRDWFAGQAMQGMQARDAYDAGQATPQQRATLAYLEADAMLASRSTPTGSAS